MICYSYLSYIFAIIYLIRKGGSFHLTESAISKSVALMNPALAVQLFGTEDRNLSLIEQAFEVQIFARDEHIEVTGQEANVIQTIDLLTELQVILQSGITIGERDVVTAIKMAKNGTLNHFVSLYEEEIGRTFEGKAITAPVCRAPAGNADHSVPPAHPAGPGSACWGHSTNTGRSCSLGSPPGYRPCGPWWSPAGSGSHPCPCCH